jgi:hypothetical protein
MVDFSVLPSKQEMKNTPKIAYMIFLNIIYSIFPTTPILRFFFHQ